jgi:hypothetical protein
MTSAMLPRYSVIIILAAALLAFTGGCARAFTGGPPGRWIATSPEGYHLVLAPEATRGDVPLHVRLHTRIVGVDNTYARRGNYRVRAFMQLRPGPNEVWLASEPARITVR